MREYGPLGQPGLTALEIFKELFDPVFSFHCAKTVIHGFGFEDDVAGDVGCFLLLDGRP